MALNRDVGEPRCPLCAGTLVEETKVVVGQTDIGAVTYRRAWICRECSAAYPIAVKTGGLLGRKEEPLYRSGQRAD